MSTVKKEKKKNTNYFSQKSFVKIWFGLVEAFRSYRSNIKKKEKKIQTQLKLICFGKNLLWGHKKKKERKPWSIMTHSYLLQLLKSSTELLAPELSSSGVRFNLVTNAT